jgi:hypothetical protein
MCLRRFPRVVGGCEKKPHTTLQKPVLIKKRS